MGALLFTMGCGLVTSLLNQAVPSGNVAANLWSDVPRMDGLTQSKIELPLAIRLLMQATIKGVMASSGDKSANLEFITFTMAQTPADLTDFYTTERMQEAGWTLKDMPGCTTENAPSSGTPNAASVGGFCLFGREDGDKGALLFVVTTEDAKTKQSDVFFARFSGSVSKLKGTTTSE
jgi:hypothetical protein